MAGWAASCAEHALWNTACAANPGPPCCAAGAPAPPITLPSLLNAHIFPARQGTLAFPAVLERLRLPAFELCKVLEPFVQQVPTLPR